MRSRRAGFPIGRTLLPVLVSESRATPRTTSSSLHLSVRASRSRHPVSKRNRMAAMANGFAGVGLSADFGLCFAVFPVG